MKQRLLTCIVCPRGCSLTVTLDDEGKVLSVEGNICKRGQVYAEDECTHPKRTVTTTVRCADGSVLPVKTSTTVPKELMFDCMKAINAAVVELPARIGDVVIHNLLGTGADVVITANAE